MYLKNKDWVIIGGLLLLAFVPIAGGISRIIKIGVGDYSMEHVRFLENPTPIVLHILAATFYSFLGVFQFSPGFRKKWPSVHMRMGRWLIVLGIVVSATGIWMTLAYPVANFDNSVVFVARLLVGFLMLTFTAISIWCIRQKNYDQHGNWMIRVYALAMGAGTQVITHIPLIAFPSLVGELSRAFSMTAGWLINFAIAELIIRLRK